MLRKQKWIVIVSTVFQGVDYRFWWQYLSDFVYLQLVHSAKQKTTTTTTKYNILKNKSKESFLPSNRHQDFDGIPLQNCDTSCVWCVCLHHQFTQRYWVIMESGRETSYYFVNVWVIYYQVNYFRIDGIWLCQKWCLCDFKWISANLVRKLIRFWMCWPVQMKNTVWKKSTKTKRYGKRRKYVGWLLKTRIPTVNGLLFSILLCNCVWGDLHAIRYAMKTHDHLITANTNWRTFLCISNELRTDTPDKRDPKQNSCDCNVHVQLVPVPVSVSGTSANADIHAHQRWEQSTALHRCWLLVLFDLCLWALWK